MIAALIWKAPVPNAEQGSDPRRSVHGKLISRNASALLQGDDNRASKYFRLTVCRARACSSGGRMRACAANSGPVTFPRIVQGATVTFGLLRMRFVLPISLRVIT